MTGFTLTPLDREFGLFIVRQPGCDLPLLRTLAGVVSNVVGAGHVCLDLTTIAGGTIRVDGTDHPLPPLERLAAELLATPAVGRGEYRPFILDAAFRLYLYRYWQYERHLADAISSRAAAPSAVVDESILAASIGRLFSAADGETDWQQVAAVAAARRRFVAISGGPGTGKTSTVVRILAMLLEQPGGANLRIALAAPTGKAAARLRESILRTKESLDVEGRIREALPEDVATIHRLLGPLPGSSRFRHHRENPLSHDVVVVDEASMVALPLMTKLVMALKPTARLILLGDRDQLASVEAGAVLGDICGGRECYSPDFSSVVGRVAGAPPPAAELPLPLLADGVVVLKKHYRFDAADLAELGARVNAGDGAAALALMKGSSAAAWRDLPSPPQLRGALAGPVVAGYRPYLQAASPEEALSLFDRFRMLTPFRKGDYGVEGVNAAARRILGDAGLIEREGEWYRGRPVLVTENDYGLRLFNGDIGIAFPDPAAGGVLRVFFPSPEGGVRGFSTVRLPPHETAFAMTVHKSQGSEFTRVLLLVPEKESDLLTRELVYTGITRARTGVEVWGTEEVFAAAVGRRTSRHSGLKDLLWGDVPADNRKTERGGEQLLLF